MAYESVDGHKFYFHFSKTAYSIDYDVTPGLITMQTMQKMICSAISLNPIEINGSTHFSLKFSPHLNVLTSLNQHERIQKSRASLYDNQKRSRGSVINK